MALLSDSEVEKALAELPGWNRAGKGIQKTYDLGGFRSALAFVNKVGELAERADHHPDILIEYRRVTFTLWTHSAGGLTHRDVDLARQIEAASRD